VLCQIHLWQNVKSASSTINQHKVHIIWSSVLILHAPSERCTNYETWRTQRERVKSVETPVLNLAVCGPNFTKLDTQMQQRLEFAKPFSIRWYFASSRRYSRSSCEVVLHWAHILRFLGRQFFWEWAPNFWPSFINSGHHRTFLCQNLVTTDRATSKIRRWKNKFKKQEQQRVAAGLGNAQ